MTIAQINIFPAIPKNHRYNLRPRHIEANMKYSITQAGQESKENKEITCTHRDDKKESKKMNCKDGDKSNESLLKELIQLHQRDTKCHQYRERKPLVALYSWKKMWSTQEDLQTEDYNGNIQNQNWVPQQYCYRKWCCHVIFTPKK